MNNFVQTLKPVLFYYLIEISKTYHLDDKNKQYTIFSYEFTPPQKR